MHLRTVLIAFAIAAALMPPAAGAQSAGPRPRAREAGVVVGIFEPGRWNAITDVDGVLAGHATRIEGDSVRTGVTAIRPHAGNLYQERVPAALVVGNGFGKLIGATQLRELGELETPILLTCTLCVWKAADAMTAWMLRQPEMEGERSLNPVVGETNDGYLNDIRQRPVRAEDVEQALESAAGGLIGEGAVGAGTGTVAFGWKGGIGTSSRVVPAGLGGWTVGVLVQSNFGGVLTINGAPVGRELGQFAFAAQLAPGGGESREEGDGSIMIVVATDAPLGSRNLERLGTRALAGLARTGASMSNGSGDYVIAFSTAPELRRHPGEQRTGAAALPNDAMSPLFQAVAEATEEAILNSLFRATTTSGHRGTVEALPVAATIDILEKYNALRWDERLPP